MSVETTPHALPTRQVAHQAGAYPGFCSMKRLGVFLLPPSLPGWDASPSQGNGPVVQSMIMLIQDYREFWFQVLNFSVRLSACIFCPRVLASTNLKLNKTGAIKTHLYKINWTIELLLILGSVNRLSNNPAQGSNPDRLIRSPTHLAF